MSEGMRFVGMTAEEVERELARDSAPASVDGLREALEEIVAAYHEHDAAAIDMIYQIATDALASPSPAPSGEEPPFETYYKLAPRRKRRAAAPEPAVEAGLDATPHDGDMPVARAVEAGEREMDAIQVEVERTVEAVLRTYRLNLITTDQAVEEIVEHALTLATPDRERERRAMRAAFHAGMDYEADEFSLGFDAWFARYLESQDSETT